MHIFTIWELLENKIYVTSYFVFNASYMLWNISERHYVLLSLVVQQVTFSWDFPLISHEVIIEKKN